MYGARLSESRHTCSGCRAVISVLTVDGLCETCHVAAGETPRSTPQTVFPVLSPITDPLATKEFPANFEDRPTFPYEANEKTSEKKERLPANPPGYELIERIGSGGMAVVYRAIQQGTQRDCAIKYVDRFLHVMSVARLEREVRAMATLDHPNVLKVFACHFGETFPNFVMEFAEGGSLAERVKKSKAGLPIEEAVALTETVARTMAFAHEKGLIHRDLKPSNLLLDTMGTLKVADFGRQLGRESASGERRERINSRATGDQVLPERIPTDANR